MNQSKNIFLKTLALTMVLIIIVIPAIPSQQYKKVEAAEGLIDIRFFNAVISMIGITAAGLATMSPSFSIPEADLVEMKDNFAQSLEADAVKKQAWLAAQTDYLAGGIAKTMGAAELAKIGFNDVYNQFINYLDGSRPVAANGVALPAGYVLKTSTHNYDIYIQNTFDTNITFHYVEGNIFSTNCPTFTVYNSFPSAGNCEIKFYSKISNSFLISNYGAYIYRSFGSGEYRYFLTFDGFVLSADQRAEIAAAFGVLNYPNTSGLIIGNTIPFDLHTTDGTGVSILPTIPWIDTTVPVGTIVSPAIAAPYAGAVPIDVPITAPIDPPIDEPVDPPIEEPTTLLGTVAAILAGILPISGILDDIKVGIDGITTTITTAIADITAPLTIVSDAVVELEAREDEYIDEWGEYRPMEELKQKFDLKLPIIAALVTGIGIMFGTDDDTRPLIIAYPYNGETKYITLDWYEPMRLQVREALALCFKLMTALSIYALLSSIFGLGVIQKSSTQMLKFNTSNDRD